MAHFLQPEDASRLAAASYRQCIGLFRLETGCKSGAGQARELLQQEGQQIQDLVESQQVNVELKGPGKRISFGTTQGSDPTVGVRADPGGVGPSQRRCYDAPCFSSSCMVHGAQHASFKLLQHQRLTTVTQHVQDLITAQHIKGEDDQCGRSVTAKGCCMSMVSPHDHAMCVSPSSARRHLETCALFGHRRSMAAARA